MRKRKSKSTAKSATNKSEPDEVVQAPHSFVIHKGLSGGSLIEITKDFRKVMEPYTASALKERKKNTIKDFVAISSLLHVSHLIIFSQTKQGMYFKVAKLPRGPTLIFRIHSLTLARDVVSSLKKQQVVSEAFRHPPLVILNHFNGTEMELKLMSSMFQNMTPSINLAKVKLNTVKRCVLFNYNTDTKLIEFRHYGIKLVPTGISKSTKKVVQGKVPNLGHCNDISEFYTKSGLLSGSEMDDDPINSVVLSQKISSRGNVEKGTSSIRLTELGPRLTLQLIKIESDLLDGEVLYHAFVQKTDEEKLEIMKNREEKRKLKDKRRKEQERNKRLKEEKKKAHRQEISPNNVKEGVQNEEAESNLTV